MYISITKQHMGATFDSSVADFTAYLEKENQGLAPGEGERFFDQYNDRIDADTVTREIDANTAKLKKNEPKFYSLTVNPSGRELAAIGNDPEKLRGYVRELMKDYASSFNRKVPVSVDDIKYYAKIERSRNYGEFDKQVRENAPFLKKIAALKNDIRKVERGELKGNVGKLEKEIKKLTSSVPHKIEGEPISVGTKKPGDQTHVHIIVSRKDASDTYSLSPGASHKASEAKLNGKTVQRGFDRDAFYEKAELTFDRISGLDRNYAESYAGRKDFKKDKKGFYKKLMRLPLGERAMAFKILREANIHMPHVPSIPVSKVQLAVKAFDRLKRGLQKALGSGSIEI